VITILSHDIRTPFQPGAWLSSLILLETDRNAINQHALTMKEISVKNLMVLNDILKLLKTDHLDDSENTQVELTELITMVNHHLSPSSKSKSIQVHIEAARPIQIFANKVLLTRGIYQCIKQCDQILLSRRRYPYHDRRKKWRGFGADTGLWHWHYGRRQKQNIQAVYKCRQNRHCGRAFLRRRTLPQPQDHHQE
jgi:hypothetical protein